MHVYLNYEMYHVVHTRSIYPTTKFGLLQNHMLTHIELKDYPNILLFPFQVFILLTPEHIL